MSIMKHELQNFLGVKLPETEEIGEEVFVTSLYLGVYGPWVLQ